LSELIFEKTRAAAQNERQSYRFFNFEKRD